MKCHGHPIFCYIHLFEMGLTQNPVDHGIVYIAFMLGSAKLNVVTDPKLLCRQSLKTTLEKASITSLEIWALVYTMTTAGTEYPHQSSHHVSLQVFVFMGADNHINKRETQLL